ncbi:MAG: hypothetical protein ACREBB_09635 [Nitrosotalea sp.]
MAISVRNNIGNSDKILEKDVLVTEYKNRKNRVEDILKKTNKYDAARVILSLLEAFDAEINAIHRRINENENQKRNLVMLGMYSNTTQHISAMLKLIDYLISKPINGKSVLSSTPSIDTFVESSRSGDFTESKQLIKEKYNKYISITYNDIGLLAGDIGARRYYAITNPLVLNLELVEQILDLTHHFWQMLMAEAALYQHYSVALRDNTLIPVNVTPQEFLEKIDLHPRNIGTSETFPNWKYDIKKSGEDTIDSTRFDRASPNNKEKLLQQRKLELDEFRKLRNFEKMFQEQVGISFNEFIIITHEISMIAYNNNDVAVVHLPKSRLLTKIRKGTGCSKKNIEHVLEVFTWKKNYSISQRPLIFDGINYLYSWTSAIMSLSSPIHECYDKTIDNDLKGKDFENDCRIIFKNHHMLVCDKRIIIDRPILTADVSIELLGYQKNGTDIDVVGARDDILFIIECKERKIPNIRENTLMNHFEKHYQELLHNARWISENFTEFQKIMNSQKVFIDTNYRFVMPLLVSNLIFTQEQQFLICNLSELEQIVLQAKPAGASTCEIKFDSGVFVKLPVYEILNQGENQLPQ